jgi:hypothetical protein
MAIAKLEPLQVKEAAAPAHAAYLPLQASTGIEAFRFFI